MINKEMIELLHISKDETGLLKDNINRLEQYKNKSGVWTMWGKTSSQNYACLEVGQTANIFKELTYDLSYLQKDYSHIHTKERYKARRLLKFGKRFAVYQCDSSRTCAKYRNIACHYSDIKVYLISSLNKDKEKREVIKLQYAIDNRAIYWNAWGKQRKQARVYYEKSQLDNNEQ